MGLPIRPPDASKSTSLRNDMTQHYCSGGNIGGQTAPTPPAWFLPGTDRMRGAEAR